MVITRGRFKSIFAAVGIVTAFAVILTMVSASQALVSSSWWQVSSSSLPTYLARGGEGKIVVAVTNLGDAPVDATSSPVTITDTLPPGLEATEVSGVAGVGIRAGLGEELAKCTAISVNCIEFTSTLPPDQRLEVTISVRVMANAKSGEENEVTVVGGGVPASATRQAITVSDTSTPFGIEDYELTPENEDGTPDTQAGSHPFQLTSTLRLNEIEELFLGFFAEPSIPELPKDIDVNLPTGLIGNPTQFPQCTSAEFHAPLGAVDRCPAETAVGVAMVTAVEPFYIGVATLPVPIFNLTPQVGEPARFGIWVQDVPVVLDVSIRTGGDYGITISSNNISEIQTLLASRVTFWGVPGDPRHNQSRGWSCVGGGYWHSIEQHLVPSCDEPGLSQQDPFLTLPTSCAGPLSTFVVADSWAKPGHFLEAVRPPSTESLNGCERLGFSPEIKVVPDEDAASTPTGWTVALHVPQEESLVPTGLAESDVASTTVTLPEGVEVSPSSADGLQACTDVPEPGRPEGEIALGSGEAVSCPNASKIGTIVIKTPLLPDPLEGSIYLAAQNANPFGSLLAIYIVVEDPTAGVLVKLAGEVHLTETGQLVTKIEQPQLPFEDATLHFFGGARAPLSTPPLCKGHLEEGGVPAEAGYRTTTVIAPWSGNAAEEPSSEFDITSGPNGGPCPNPPPFSPSLAQLPFAPSLTGGTTNIQAGDFSPFTMTMSREDGNQNLQGIQLHMPPGLLGTLSSVKLCEEPQADAGTCGPESLIGHTVVSVGLGGDPYTVSGGQVFITGPYDGAPYGLSIVEPAKAGPFNLGTVVVRAKIEVNPSTAALTITTDSEGPYKIPTILRGIPLQIKHVNATIDRSSFTFNPTDCNPLSITGTLTSTEGATSALSVPFQVTDCATLAFKPKFTVSTSGHTSRLDGASLDTKVTYPSAPQGSEADIAKVKVSLPVKLPARLSTLQKACTEKTFAANPATCPAASRVGEATTKTPVLPTPLSGPAYFVSHGGAKYPELVVVLQGDNVTIDLRAETFISKKGILTTTFNSVPDAPFSSFELSLPKGSFSALTANGKNLCNAGSLTMPTEFVAQDGAVLKQNTKIDVTGCPKKVKHKAKKGKKKK